MDPENGSTAMTEQTALEIARSATLKPITDVAALMGIGPDLLEPYGEFVTKIKLEAISALQERPTAKYILVTAVTPTPFGEGKTTTTIGLAQGMHHLGRTATAAIRQPSMGPTFGIKGGGAGGGYSQAAPFEAINLHLTGDMHAVTAAHNTLAAMVDNHLFHGNELGIDIDSVTWRRVLDVNDRALRNVEIGLGPAQDGIERSSGFDITAASEVMAILALSTSLKDMRARLGRIIIGFTFDQRPVTAEDLRAAGAMAVIMKDAIKPNLLQTLENTPVLVHAGPFGNIAHGNSSVVADLIGIHTGEFLITEAGFGADMGAERFFNIKCRVSGLSPDAGVVVTTVRALKSHSGTYKITAGKPLPDAMLFESPDDVRRGIPNLRKQVENLKVHGITPVIAINAFPDDFDSEYEVIRDLAREMGVRCAVSTHFAEGGAGASALAQAVIDAANDPSTSRFLYELDATPEEKIDTIARAIYGADGIDLSDEAAASLRRYEQLGFGSLPICIAKTHLSLSSDPLLKGAPRNWRLPVREVRLSAGAGFLYAICGEMRTMPGLSSHPAAEEIDIDEDGNVVGLY